MLWKRDDRLLQKREYFKNKRAIQEILQNVSNQGGNIKKTLLSWNDFDDDKSCFDHQIFISALFGLAWLPS